MSYSYAVNAKAAPAYGRVAAAALLAVSAGACVGVALSPMVNNYAPAAVRPAVASQMVATSAPRVALQAAPEMVPFEQVAAEAVAPPSTASASGWAALSGCSFAAAAALVVMAFRGNKAESSEQIAMMAAFGSKKKASTVTKSKVQAADGERKLWYPTAVAPEWLDGSLPGDRGFDPLGLSKPTEYLQFDLDSLDQNAPKNVAGGAIGRFQAQPDELTQESLVPYSEVFGLQRFRECELIHGRWAMLGVLGVLVAEAVTGVAWQNAGLVEVSGPPTYWGFELPFSGTQVVWTEVLTMGFVEVFRNTELDLNKRCYPGGAFDPLGLASKDEATTFRLKEAELKHGRLAMVAFLGFTFASLNTGLGATQAFNSFVQGFN